MFILFSFSLFLGYSPSRFRSLFFSLLFRFPLLSSRFCPLVSSLSRLPVVLFLRFASSLLFFLLSFFFFLVSLTIQRYGGGITSGIAGEFAYFYVQQTDAFGNSIFPSPPAPLAPQDVRKINEKQIIRQFKCPSSSFFISSFICLCRVWRLRGIWESIHPRFFIIKKI